MSGNSGAQKKRETQKQKLKEKLVEKTQMKEGQNVKMCRKRKKAIDKNKVETFNPLEKIKITEDR